jgi:hypothetical protein
VRTSHELCPSFLILLGFSQLENFLHSGDALGTRWVESGASTQEGRHRWRRAVKGKVRRWAELSRAARGSEGPSTGGVAVGWALECAKLSWVVKQWFFLIWIYSLNFVPSWCLGTTWYNIGYFSFCEWSSVIVCFTWKPNQPTSQTKNQQKSKLCRGRSPKDGLWAVFR